MSGKKSKKSRKNNPVVRTCPTRVERGQIWKSGTFVTGEQVISDLKLVSRKFTNRKVLPAVTDSEKVHAALQNFEFIRTLNPDTLELLKWSAESVDTTVEGVLAELLANNLFPPNMSKKDWLDQGYAGTWLNEQDAVQGLLRTHLSALPGSRAVADDYQVIAGVSPLNVFTLDSGRTVVSSVLPNNTQGRVGLIEYLFTRTMRNYLIP